MPGNASIAMVDGKPPPEAGPPTPELMQRVQQAVFEALPGLAVENLVELLEFIAVQHSGSNFNADNQSKALEIAAFCRTKTFACSTQGVASLARLARHALGSGNGEATSAEHQLWLLASGALNTAAAVRAHDGDAVSCFDTIRTDGNVRGRYMQRIYAQHAMQDHLQKPKEALVDPNAPDPNDPDEILKRKMQALKPVELFCAAIGLFIAVVAGIIFVNETAMYTVAGSLGF
jgi:hypothetical protein